jgi:hypothetical protein
MSQSAQEPELRFNTAEQRQPTQPKRGRKRTTFDSEEDEDSDGEGAINIRKQQVKQSTI